MTGCVFNPAFEDLPGEIPVFPLSGVLLLPGGHLPLNIFEPRYLAMVDEALAGDRIIGMIQPAEEDNSNTPYQLDARKPGSVAPNAADRPAIYGTGCAGRINAFSETDDGRYLITLTGLIRFEVASELEIKNGFRRVAANYQRFASDLSSGESEIDREQLLETLRGYFSSQGIRGDWETIGQTENEHLVTSLAMICPFAASEKQLLLEAMTLQDRAETMTKIMEMAMHQPGSDTSSTGFSRH